MRVGLDHRVWVRPETEEERQEIEKCRAHYTYQNPDFVEARRMGRSTYGIDPTFELAVIRDGWVGFPRSGELPQASYRPPEWDTRALGREVDFELYASEWHPRAGQKDAVDALVHALTHNPYGGVLEAPCGTGKTEMGIQIIRRMRRTAVILVSSTSLMNQWEGVLKARFPGARIGRTSQDTLSTGREFDVVVAMVQSVVSRSYEGFFDSFGVLLYDECHHGSAVEFSKCFDLFPAKHRIGLTATPDRKDGLMGVYLDHLGPIAHTIVVERPIPHLHVRRLHTELDPRKYLHPKTRKPLFANIITELARVDARNALIVKDAISAAKAGRRVMILSDRRDHLTTLMGKILFEGIECGLYLGGMSDAEKEKSLSYPVLLGTYHMASEGLDAPDRDTLLLATPRVDIRQSVGRIQREFQGKKHPMVVDYLDVEIPLLAGMGYGRRRHYSALDMVPRRS
jgi:superfamily II DNA or RNA helicase